MKKHYLLRGILLSSLFYTLALAQNPPAPDALPEGGRVVAGEAAIGQTDSTLSIYQSSDRAAIDWNSFDVGSRAKVEFLQPSNSSVTLNRVTGNNASQIFGRITANGQVFLSNPNGVHFAPGASVNVGGLVATTHGISIEDFMAGRAKFERNGATGSVINEGELTAALGGYIALLAPTVRNQGVILANLGTVAMAAGETFELQFGSNNTLANLRVTPSTIQSLVENRSAVLAPGGIIILSAQGVDRIQGGVIRNSGTLEATGLAQRGGRIVLEASDRIEHSGRIDASTTTEGEAGQGGSIALLGKDIALNGTASLLATGTSGGGSVLVGGGWQGGGGLPQATTVTMDADALIDVGATQNGDGGTAVLWSDVHAAQGSTRVHGSILARGGAAGGNGGDIETSGYSVDVTDLRVDASAAHGAGGQWLIDPFNYTINAAAATAITGALNASTSVLVTTTVSNASFGGSTNSADTGVINVSSAIAKTAGNDATLTLQAHRRVNVNAPISSTSGRLNLVLWSDYANTNLSGVSISSPIGTNGGHVWIGGSSTNGGSQIWNGLTVGDGPSVGSSSDNFNGMDFGGNISTSGGDVLIWAGTGSVGGSSGPGIGLFGSRTISAGSGNVTLIANRVFDYSSGMLAINSTGTLTLAPALGNAYDAAFNWTGSTTSGNFTLNNTLSANTLRINSVNSLGGLTLGRYTAMSGTTIANTSDVTITNALSVAGAITFYGGQITLNGSVTSTNTGDIFIKALSSSNPSININANILKTGGARSTLTLQGNGRVFLQSGRQIQATGTALDTIVWSDYDNSNNDGGVSFVGNVTTNGGHFWAGGSNSNGGSYTWNGLTVGDGASIGSSGNNFNAMDLYGTVSTSGGDILLWAGSGFSGGLNGIGSNSTGSMNAGSGNITLITGETAGTFPIRTTGTLSIVPDGGSFPSAFTWSGTGSPDYTLSGSYSGLRINSIAGLGGLTIGQYSGMSSGGTPVVLGNSSNITISDAINIPGAISLYGGNIAINAELTATGANTITLLGSGNVTEGASGFVSALNLLLLGGNVTLDSSNNGVGYLAASGVGGLTYIDNNTLVLDTVGSTNGISATGAVNIGTLVGDLTVLQNVITTNASSTALTLNAGINAAAGTATDGNIFVFNNSTIGVGAGGRGRLFSGSVADSGGVSALIGSGSNRFRYNSDESVTNYTLALGTGLYAIYREQPTVSLHIDNQSMVYGGTVPTWTFTLDSARNGDTYAQSFTGAPGVSVGGATSTSSQYIAGAHALTGSIGSAASQLGYAVSPTITAGTLTVTPRTLTVNYTGNNRIYDGSTAATVNDSDNRVGGDVLTLVETAAFSDPNAGTGKTVNITGIGVSGTDAANYTLASTIASTTADITARTVTLSGNRVYDGTPLLGAGTVTLGNLVGAETLGFSGATANDAHVATGGKYVSSITLLDGTNGGLASNYQLPTLNAANAPVMIAARAIGGSATIGGTLSKIYDGTTAATGASVSGSVTGAVSGDVLLLDISAISLVYNSAHVTSATSIGASGAAGFTIGSSTHGSQTSDYSFIAPTLSPVAASITPATLTPTLTNSGVTKVYDGTTNAPAGFTPAWSFSGLVAGDTAAALTDSGTAYNSKDVSTASNIIVSGIGIGSITGSNGSVSTDYALDASSKSVAASITPRAVTVTGLAASDKTYDGTNTAGITHWGSVSTGVGSETLTLSAAGAAFGDTNAGTGKTVTATGYALLNGSNGGLGGNYSLTSTAATTTANINKAVLTVTANDDAKFVTRPDAPGYSGLSYSGFVNGETAAVLPGVAAVTRGNSGTDTAGVYTDVLAPDVSGLSSTNYSFMLQNGDYTIVPSNQLLVRVASSTAGYGTQLGYTIGSAEYLDANTNNVVSLTSITDDGNGRFTVNDGVGGSASFTVALENAPLSGAGFARAGAYQLDAADVTTLNAQNFSNQLTLTGSRNITQRGISASAANGVTKVYDGTTAMVGVQVGLIGAEGADAVTVSGFGEFSSRNAGTNLGYTVNGLTLGGDDAANYYLTGGTSFSGANGTITPRTLVVNYGGVNKVYDGGTNASITTSDNRIAGDALAIAASAAFVDKNVGTGKAVTISGVTLSGADAGNYLVSASGSAAADITRLDSVTWVGGTDGNWFDPANWAGGAVPDLSNVANVILPTGVVVTFDTSGAVAPAQTGPVHLDSLGTAGSVTQNDGELAIGAGSIQLDGYTQHGGTLGSGGDIVLGSFTQTGGSASTGGDFTVDGNFSQGASGSVSIGGDANITTAGGTTVGNLTTGGDLNFTSTDGDITQANGTTIAMNGRTTVNADNGSITLNGANNDFIGAFNASGNNVTVTDGQGGLVLGNVNATGTLRAMSANGNLTQAVGAAINVTGTTTLQAPGNNVRLNLSGNTFGGGLSVVDASPTATTPPVPPPAAPALRLPTPRMAPPMTNVGSMGVSVRLITVPSDQTQGLVTVDVPREMTSTGFTFALPEEVVKDLPADTRITATREKGGRLPAWLTFDARRQRFVATQIPANALPLRVAVTIGTRRLTVVISVV